MWVSYGSPSEGMLPGLWTLEDSRYCLSGLIFLDGSVVDNCSLGESSLESRSVNLEPVVVRHESQSQTPAHDIEEHKAGSVLIVGTTLIQDLICGLLTVQNDHVVSKDIEVNNIRI